MSETYIYITEEHLHPQYQFVKSYDNPSKGYPSLHLLEGQYIKVSNDPTKFIKSDTSWHISANRKKRSEHPIGTIFKIEGCTWRDNGKKQWCIASNRDMLEPVEYADAVDQIIKYKDAIEDADVEKEKEEESDLSEEKKDSKPTTNYLIDLLDKHKCPTIKKDGFYVSEKNWKQLIRHVDRRKNTMIIGDSGTGKTEICKILSDKFDLPLITHDMGATQDPIASLIGVHRMEDSKSVFDFADFVNDIQTPCIILLDEVNRAPLNANNILFPLLDRRRVLRLSIASSKLDREVKVHPDTRFIATANIGNEFTGTNVLDTAFVNRFQLIELGYPPQITEISLLHERTGLDINYAKKVIKVAKGIRDKKKNDDISMGMSIRQTIDVAEMIVDGFTVKEALEYYLEPIFKEEYQDIKDILQSV